jgi:hypothetical protein
MIKRKRRKVLFGYVVAESRPGFFYVMFDVGTSRSVASNSLKIYLYEHPLASRISASRRAALIIKQEIGEEDADNNEEEDDERGDPENESSNEDKGGSHQNGQVAIDGQATGDGSAIGTAPGGLFIGEDIPTNYHEKLADAHNKISGMLGQTTQKDTFIWTVIAEHHVQDLQEQTLIGVKGIDLYFLDRKHCFAMLFLHMMFKDWKASTRKTWWCIHSSGRP